MGVGIDGAGQNQLAGRVHDLGALRGKIIADGGNLAVLHRNVGLEHLGRRHDGTVLDD